MHSNAARNVHNVVLRELIARAAPGRVLDAPCGGGALASRMSDAGFDVIGLDIDPIDTQGKFEFRRTDLSLRLPLGDAEVDTVVSVEGIEHLERPFDFVRECRRVLRDGGLLIMTTPNISSLRSRWRWFLTGFHHKAKYALDETSPSPLHHVNMLSYHRLRYILHTNGFHIEAVTTNRRKPMNWLYAPVVPLVYAVSRLGIAMARSEEVNPAISRDVFANMMSRDLLFGELMVMIARKTQAASVG
jgi:2-polyprenyl-3-methyl-5-hydroxy-6-metoxy-1,4-benzoquinol methylase